MLVEKCVEFAPAFDQEPRDVSARAQNFARAEHRDQASAKKSRRGSLLRTTVIVSMHARPSFSN
jgi:hypothetical protein